MVGVLAIIRWRSFATVGGVVFRSIATKEARRWGRPFNQNLGLFPQD